jgi:signal transduction histidine kinase
LIVAAGFYGPALVYKANLILVIPTVGLGLIVTWLAIARKAADRLDPVTLLLGCGFTAVMTCWVNDLLSLLNVTSDLRTFTARLSYSLLMVAIGIGLTWRFARALNEVDGFAQRTATMLSEAEDRLRATFAQEEKPARAAALAAERGRLMRDLHDGLGGQLVSIVALSERKGGDGDPIGDAARAALRDLRLVIDAMDDIDGDLMLALGAWRERAEAQLRPHGMSLDWQVRSPSGLPVHPELHPWHVLQILRLLDEAVTNAVKHSAATRLTVILETVEPAEGRHGRIVIQDNGRGFDPARTGAVSSGHRGLVNMRMRARRCGAELELTSDGTGTRLQLDLPNRFPGAEHAAG